MKKLPALIALLLCCCGSLASAAEPLRLVFLGDNGHHQPARRAAELLPVLEKRDIHVQYTDDVAATLQPDRLKDVDGLIVYANIDQITDDQADALLQYVDQGGGFIPLHCASFCFRNNEEIVALVGAQFQRHTTGTFVVQPTDAAASHPIMQGYRSFQSWDETYVHTKHNEVNRTVLEYRQEGDAKEPWTWVRTHGKGRVFYTAWGHDQRTFGNEGFHNLVERGIRWACGQDPSVVPAFAGYQPDPLDNVEMTEQRKDVAPFEFADVGPKIPNYVVGERWGEQEKPKNLMQKPLPPAESSKHYVMPKGFELELFASEPDIGGKPITMSWDERGRLWVAETYDYPNERQPAGSGRDRIRICEDTDGDFVADKFTVFADQLSIPTSMAFSHGGVIVHQAPDTLFLKDTDGDSVADVRKVLFTGWSTSDTHAGPSNLNYGHDNWFYGVVGYAGFQGEIAGQQRSFRTGFYRFQVQEVDGEVAVTDFEFLRNTNNNTWGLGFSEEGLLFASTANRNPSEFMPIANRYYERVRGWTSSVLTGIADTHLFKPTTHKVRQVDHHGGYTAAAGHALYTARRYPQEYWNRTAFVTGPTGHLVGTFVLEPQGSEFRSTNKANLLGSDDEWAAPIMAEVGPDGNVWVIDWYNYIVQHNPTPVGFQKGPGNAYMTDLRDKKHGRIYRVVHGEEATPITSLHEATKEDLIAALKSDNMMWRRHAQRLLIERGDLSVVEGLSKLAQDTSVDDIGLNVGAIHALRTLHGLHATNDTNVRAIVDSALQHPSAGVVRAAIEVLPNDAESRDALLAANATQHADAQVRLAGLLALADLPPSASSAKAAVQALVDHSEDRWIKDAAISAGANSGGPFLVVACQTDLKGNNSSALTIVAEHLARSKDSDSIKKLIVHLVDASSATQNAIIAGLTKGWPRDAEVELSEQDDDAILSLFDKLSPGGKGQLIRLAASWGSKKLAANADKIGAALLAIVEDESATETERIQSAKELMGLMSADSASVTRLLKSISPRTPQSVAIGIVNAAQASRAADVGSVLLKEMERYTPAVRLAALRVLLARPETSLELVEAIAEGKVARGDLTLDQQQALMTHPNRELRKRSRQVISVSGGLPDPDREKVLISLMKVTENAGDIAKGRVIFKKNCGNCHMHQGEGNKVGPDLTGMAVHPKAELLTHIVDPSRSVEGNYRSYSLLTVDGIVITGMLASETQTSIEMFDAQGKKHAVLREDIEQLIASTKSVMPEGFEKNIDEQGFTDLLEFLTAKGKYLPLPLDKAATAISTKGLFHDGDEGADRLVFDDWSPKRVGEIPFHLIDPQGKRSPNIVLLHGPRGTMPPKMPHSVRIPCNSPAKAIHLLSGVSGWGFPAHGAKSVSMIVRLHLEDGKTEDHELVNGVHFADYIRRVDVPGSEFAMMVRGQQLRHVVVKPETSGKITEIELVKGDDPTSPIVAAVTIE